MGHREQLMIGAKRCLEERGYARTTSRDIAAAANAPLGTINYHYGSKEGLLNAALLESVMEWGEKVVPTRPEGVGPGAGPGAASGAGVEAGERPGTGVVERLERMWSRIIASHTTADRPMLVASVEAMAQAQRSPEIRRQIADAYERSRPEMAAGLHGIDAASDEETARAVGSVHMALVAGLSQQWLIDPERAPSARDVAAGLRAIARSLESDA
ncbi:TetR/AcrR family transcriptional regulator [Streptomyces sp. NPDC088400]|uniref:TetR/AcrR family transcriptional regulator n=1 Tax=Streptomyces sp. NPDC088400 TaxID=3365861 RepID=UPI0038131562